MYFALDFTPTSPELLKEIYDVLKKHHCYHGQQIVDLLCFTKNIIKEYRLEENKLILSIVYYEYGQEIIIHLNGKERFEEWKTRLPRGDTYTSEVEFKDGIEEFKTMPYSELMHIILDELFQI